MDKKVLVIGDSWASAVVAGEPECGGWPEMLGVPQELRQGIGGSTAALWASDDEGRLYRALAEDPMDVVIISLMGNDAIAAAADGLLEREELDTAIRNMQFVIASIADRLWSDRIIVFLYTDPFFPVNNGRTTMIGRLNAAIRSACPDTVEIFDTSSVLLPEHFDGIDIHPNRAGHEAIAAGLRKMLEEPR